MHGFDGWPKYPQGQGFIAATSIMLEGYVKVPAVLDTVTTPSSSGWRNDSFALLSNSGNSSINITPL